MHDVAGDALTPRSALSRRLLARVAGRLLHRPAAGGLARSGLEQLGRRAAEGTWPGWAGLALVLLLTLAAPALGMRTWPQDGGSAPTDATIRKATT